MVRSSLDATEATKRELGAWGYNWTTLFLGDINTGTWPSSLGGLETETVKYGHQYPKTRTRK
jgi:hypothetical protein